MSNKKADSDAGVLDFFDLGADPPPEATEPPEEVATTYLGLVDQQVAWRITADGLLGDGPAIVGTKPGTASRQMAIGAAFDGVLRCDSANRADLTAMLVEAAQSLPEDQEEAGRLLRLAAEQIQRNGVSRLGDLVPEPNLSQPTSAPYYRIIHSLMNAGSRARDLGVWRRDPDGVPYTRQIETRKYRMAMAARQLEIPTVAPFDDEDKITLWRDVIMETSPETTQVFMALMHKAALMPDPRGLAYITVDELVALRGVRTRQGSERKLREDLTAEVARLAQYEVSFSSKRKGWPSKTHEVGKRIPGRLVDILDHRTREANGRRREGFFFRPGAVLLLFLGSGPESVRRVGRFHPSLLRLNPARDKLALGIGLYLSYLANLNGPRFTFTLAKALDYAGHVWNDKRPGETAVEPTLRAFQQLEEMGAVEMPKGLDPERSEGYFQAWLSESREATVHLPALTLPEPKTLPLPKRARRRQQRLALAAPQTAATGAPDSADQIDGQALKAFRQERRIRQGDLAKWLGVSISLVSACERGTRRIKPRMAQRIWQEWKEPRAFVL